MTHLTRNKVLIIAITLGIFFASGGKAHAAEPQVRTEQLHALWPHPQSTPDNTVRVEPGIVSTTNNAKIEYAGGNSPTFSAVSANSRIDLVTINSSGVLEITQGTQGANPSPPTYPTSKLVLAEVTVNETVSVVINSADIKDVRFFLNLGGGVSGLSDLSDAEVTTPAAGHLLLYDTTDSRFENVALSGDATISSAGALTVANNAITTAKLAATSVTAAKLGSDVTGTGLTGGNGSALAVDVGTTANKIVQLDANAKLPAVDSSQLINLPTQWTTSGSDLYYTTGNVGIGTSGPARRLHVYGAGSSQALLQLQSSDNDQSYLKFINAQTGTGLFTDGFILGVDSDETIAIYNYENTAMRFATNGSERLRIDNAGLLGLGTISPSAFLDLEKEGTAKSALDIVELTNKVNALDMDATETGVLFNQWYYDASTPAVADAAKLVVGTETDWTSTAATQDSYLALHTALDGTVAEKVRITSGGNVGIGSTSPGAKLDVNGTVKMTGFQLGTTTIPLVMF